MRNIDSDATLRKKRDTNEAYREIVSARISAKRSTLKETYA